MRILNWLVMVYVWVMILFILFIGMLAAVLSLFRRHGGEEILKA